MQVEGQDYLYSFDLIYFEEPPNNSPAQLPFDDLLNENQDYLYRIDLIYFEEPPNTSPEQPIYDDLIHQNQDYLYRINLISFQEPPNNSPPQPIWDDLIWYDVPPNSLPKVGNDWIFRIPPPPENFALPPTHLKKRIPSFPHVLSINYEDVVDLKELNILKRKGSGVQHLGKYKRRIKYYCYYDDIAELYFLKEIDEIDGKKIESIDDVEFKNDKVFFVLTLLE